MDCFLEPEASDARALYIEQPWVVNAEAPRCTWQAGNVPGNEVVPTFGFLPAAPEEAAAKLVDTRYS